MKKYLFGLVLMATPLLAQDQLNVGLAARRDVATPIVDAVLMHDLGPAYIYGQVTYTGTQTKPELYAAFERPLINFTHVYIGLDAGLGWPVNDQKNYGKRQPFIGFTSWMPIAQTFGLYWMASKNPYASGAPTIQGGIFKQVF